MRKLTGILFALFMVILFLEILIGFPIQLETERDASWIEAYLEQPEKDPEIKEKERLEREKKDALQKELSTQLKMEGVHLVESQQGSRDWELIATAAENTKGDGILEVKEVKALFYNNEKVDFTVTGAEGTINTQNKDMKIRGKVVTRSSNGYTFESETIEYVASQRILRSPEKVSMIGPPDERGKGFHLTGSQLEAQVEKSLMTIYRNVVAQKELLDGKKFKINSNQAEFSGKNQTAKFSEDVAIEVGTMKMEGPEAQFEYKSGSQFLNSVLVKGGVKVSDLDKFATSDTVRFDPIQNRFVLNGRPRVVQNNDEITGEQIVFIDGGKRVKVEKIRGKVENR